MAVRMKDIARDLGVSAVTVSKVLLNHGDIGPETRERVLRRIKELNYQSNQNARALATGGRIWSASLFQTCFINSSRKSQRASRERFEPAAMVLSWLPPKKIQSSRNRRSIKCWRAG
jgi:DNA-binding LacI/PurR family transcriptional regulator